MPKAPKLKAEEKATVPEENPLLEFIEDWEEPKLKAEAEPKIKPEAKAEPEAPAKLHETERPAPKTEKAAPEKVDNPLLKFIDEWEEPKAAPKKKK
jgi:hypothetical protein